MRPTSIDDPKALQAFLAGWNSEPTYSASPRRPEPDHRTEDKNELNGNGQTKDPPFTAAAAQEPPSPEMIAAGNTQPGIKHGEINASPLPSKTTSPKLGTIPSENTLQAVAAASHLASTSEKGPIYNPRAVSEAFYDFVQAMDGKSLSESMWAPKPAAQQPSLRGGSQGGSKAMIPTELAQTKAVIYDRQVLSEPIIPNAKVTREMIHAATQTDLTSTMLSKLDHLTLQTLAHANSDTQRDDQLTSKESLDSPASAAPKRPVAPHSVTKSTKSTSAGFEDQHLPTRLAQTTEGTSLNPLDRLVKANEENTSPLNKPSLYRSKRETETRGQVVIPPPECSSEKPALAPYGLSSEFAQKWFAKQPAIEPIAAGNGAVKEEGEITPTGDEPETSPVKPVMSKPTSQRPLFDPTAYRKNAPGTNREDRTDQLFFKSWGPQERRDRPAGEIRTVVLKALPPSATPAFVTSVVFGGPLEQIHMRSDGVASVRFLHGAACREFYDETANGLVYGKNEDGREKVIWVHLGKEIDIIGGHLEQWISMGRTRCIRAAHVDQKLSLDFIKSFATGKGRVLEGIEDTMDDNGPRIVIFRFAKIDDAIAFRGVLAKNEEWEQYNIQFCADP